MTNRFLQIATTPSVAAAQRAHGSRAAYARREDGPVSHDRLGPAETAFIAARDSFYLASVSSTGWPYVQHRGGPPGFLKVLEERLLGFADLAGNRQYLTLGNVVDDDRIALFLMDYPNRRRLKILGHLTAADAAEQSALIAGLFDGPDRKRVERAMLVTVEAFDWNCPQHITPRYTEAELATALGPVRDELARLQSENATLHAQLDTRAPRTDP